MSSAQEGEQPAAAAPGGEQPTELIPQTGEQPAAGVPAATGGEAAQRPAPEGESAQRPAPEGESAQVPAATQGGAAQVPATTGGEAPEVPATTGDKTALVPATTGDKTALVPVTGEAAAPAAARDLPAGVDAGELETAPGSARRGKLRRRLGYLRRMRELLLRDLGGFTYELQRTGGGVVREGHRRLIETKTGRIAALDSEVRDLETRLGEPHADPVLRVPGVGGTCPECGELHSSDARYCWHCGTPLDAKARAEREAAILAAVKPVTAAHPTPEPQAASVLWAAGPRPQASEAAEKPEDHTATSQWLATGGDKPGPKPDEAATSRGEDVSGASAPVTGAAASSAGGGDPSAAAADSSAATADSGAATGESSAAAADPGAATADPGAATDDPIAATDPSATAGEPGAATDDSSAKADEPRAGGESAATDDSSAEAGEPRAGGESAADTDSSGASPDSDAGADDSNAVADATGAAAGATGTADATGGATDEPGTAGEQTDAAGESSDAAATAQESPATDQPADEGETDRGNEDPAGAEAQVGESEAATTEPGDRAEARSGPNGRRDEDVPPPTRPGDPLGSRSDQPS